MTDTGAEGATADEHTPVPAGHRANDSGSVADAEPDSARTSSRLANDAWETLLTAHAALMKEFAAEDVWQGLTMREYDVLYTLAKCREPVRPAELNRHVLLTQPALSRMVDRLVGRGLVQRTRDPRDGRGVRLSLTAAGRARQRRVGGRHAVGVARALTGALTDEELRTLEALCAKLADTTNGNPR